MSSFLALFSDCTPTDRPFGAAQGRKERAQSVQEHKPCLSHASHHGPRGPLHSAPECRIRPIALPKTYSKYSGLRRLYPLEANFVPSSARAIIAKFARQSPFLTCAGKEPARVALTPGPPGAARSPGRTGESPPGSRRSRRCRRRPRPSAAARSLCLLRLFERGGGVWEPWGGGGRGDLAYLRWRRATPGRPLGLCAAAGRARSSEEQATTNGDISRRSTWRAERAGVPRRSGRQPSPHRRDVGERESCSHPAAH